MLMLLRNLTIVVATFGISLSAMALDRGQEKSLARHIEWCVSNVESLWARQDIDIFVPGTDELRNLNLLRRSFVYCQRHNRGAVYLLDVATDHELKRAINTVTAKIEDQVTNHLRWVAYDRRRAIDLVDAARLWRPEEIRRIYMSEQAHNLKARLLLSSVSDVFLIDTAEQL